jgi:hypothetical protein
VTLFDFLSLINNVNVPSKSNKQKKLCWKISFLLASWRSMMKITGSGSGSESGSISQRHGSPDPDPHQNVMDQEHCLWWTTPLTSTYFPPAEYLGPIPLWLITEFCTMIMSLLEKQKIVELQTLYSSLHLQTSQAPLSFQVSNMVTLRSSKQ